VSENKGEAIQIRPHAFGLMPFSLPLLALPIVLIYSSWAHTNSNHLAVVVAVVVTIAALATWVLTYHWRARITVNSIDRTLEVRGRLLSRSIHGRDVRSTILYGPNYNQAVAYLDRHDRRLLTLRLGYWSLADIRTVNDRLGILLNEWEKPKVSPPGKGLLTFLERHRNWVGASIPLLAFVGVGVAIAVWTWWPH
jgi:hypothetical protein